MAERTVQANRAQHDRVVEQKGRPTLTCIRADDEASERAEQLEAVLTRVEDVKERERLVTGYLRWLARLGREARPGSDQPQGRARLQELQQRFTQELEEIIGTPVLPPPIKAYEREGLEPLDAKDVRSGLRKPQWIVVGRQFTPPTTESFDSLTGASLDTAQIIDSRFTDVSFEGASFGPGTILSRTSFSRCSFDNIHANGLRASSVIFEDCTFNGAALNETSFGYCVFRDPHHQSVSSGIELGQAAFTYTNVASVAWQGASMAGASFTECDLHGSALFDCEAGGTVFCRTSLKDVDLSGTDLTQSVFRHCDLRGTVFTPVLGRGSAPTTLSNANLREAFQLNVDGLTSEQRQAASWGDMYVDDFLAELDRLYYEHAVDG